MSQKPNFCCQAAQIFLKSLVVKFIVVARSVFIVSGFLLVGCGGTNKDPSSFVITATSDDAGSISPNSIEVIEGLTAEFTLEPSTNYEVDTVTGCSGVLSGTYYTTGVIAADCSVKARFKQKPTYTLSWGTAASNSVSDHICKLDRIFSYDIRYSSVNTDNQGYKNSRKLCGGERPAEEPASYQIESFFSVRGYSMSGNLVGLCTHTELAIEGSIILGGYNFECKVLPENDNPSGISYQTTTFNIQDYDLSSGVDLIALENDIAMVSVDTDVLLEIPEGRFILNRKFQISRSIKIIGAGINKSFLLGTSAIDGPLIDVSNGSFSELSAVANIIKGDRNFSFMGDLYALDDDLCDHLVVKDRSQVWPYDERDYVFYGEVSQIEKIEFDTVYLAEVMRDNYNSNASLITIFCPLNVQISDVSIHFSEKNLGTKAVSVSGASKVMIARVSIQKSGRVGIFIADSRNVVISQSVLSDGFPEDCNTCYGIQTYGVQDALIADNQISYFRRGIDISGTHPSRRILVEGNSITSTGNIERAATGLGTHGSAEDILFRDNITDSGILGILIRGSNIVVEKNDFSNPEWAGVYVDAGSNHYIRDNIIGGKRLTGRLSKRGITFGVPTLHNTTLVSGNSINADVGVRVKSPPKSLIILDNAIVGDSEHISIEFDTSENEYSIVSEGWHSYNPD